MDKYYGQLSRDDIIRELQSGNLIIEPRAKKDEDDPKIKSASFDISPSCLIMSVKKGRFLRIYSSISRCELGHRNPEWHCNACQKNAAKKGQNHRACTEQRYVYIDPRDTVLILSKEYLKLPDNMCGNVFSRVSTVSSGLGHISTTIDPLWKGALLIAISNPSSEPIKLLIEDANAASIPLATVTLQYLNTPVDANTVHSTHLPARVDILETYLYNIEESKTRLILIKNSFFRCLYIKDYNLTVNLINQLKGMKDTAPKDWAGKLSELEQQVCAQKIRGNKWRTYVLEALPVARGLLLSSAMCFFAFAV